MMMLLARAPEADATAKDGDVTAPWRQREHMRIQDGTYKRLPWELPPYALAPIPDHFAHVSRKDARLIAYTESERKGTRDIQTQIKPGRYLQEFYTYLNQDEIRKYSALVCVAVVGLHFARTAEDIRHVMLNGPSSCMAQSEAVVIFGDSDLALAYMTTDRGAITARTFCWPDRCVYYYGGYGDVYRLHIKLKEAGYKKGGHGCFAGAKLRRVAVTPGDKTRIWMPGSFDGHGRFDLIPGDKDHIVISDNGKYRALSHYGADGNIATIEVE